MDRSLRSGRKRKAAAASESSKPKKAKTSAASKSSAAISDLSTSNNDETDMPRALEPSLVPSPPKKKKKKKVSRKALEEPLPTEPSALSKGRGRSSKSKKTAMSEAVREEEGRDEKGKAKEPQQKRPKRKEPVVVAMEEEEEEEEGVEEAMDQGRETGNGRDEEEEEEEEEVDVEEGEGEGPVRGGEDGNDADVEEEEGGAAGAGEEEEVVKEKVVKPKKSNRRRNFLKPIKGSWLTHAGSIVICRCVQDALSQSEDYRQALEETDWPAVLKTTLTNITQEDMKLIWILIKKEFEDMPLKEIVSETKGSTRLSAERFAKEEIRLKFKDEMPKLPMSAYMLFSHSVKKKFMEKHPGLTQRELAGKIGSKWQSMAPEKQQKYRDEYLKAREEYYKQLDDFWEEHPEAKPKRERRVPVEGGVVRKTRVPKELDPEETRIAELKRLRPKCPPTAYAQFCRQKKPVLQEKYPDLTTKEIKAKLSEKWKAKDTKGKTKYRKMHLDMLVTYEEEIMAFNEKYPDADRLLARKKSKKKAAAAAAAIAAPPRLLAATATAKTPAGAAIPSKDDSSEEEEEEEEPIKKSQAAKAPSVSGEESSDSDTEDDGKSGGREAVKSAARPSTTAAAKTAAIQPKKQLTSKASSQQSLTTPFSAKDSITQKVLPSSKSATVSSKGASSASLMTLSPAKGRPLAMASGVRKDPLPTTANGQSKNTALSANSSTVYSPVKGKSQHQFLLGVGTSKDPLPTKAEKPSSSQKPKLASASQNSKKVVKPSLQSLIPSKGRTQEAELSDEDSSEDSSDYESGSESDSEAETVDVEMPVSAPFPSPSFLSPSLRPPGDSDDD